ncbi:hypothetical protein D3C75_460990 [compost metagenome]
MKRNFVLSSHNDKPTVSLEVVNDQEAICTCGETITRSMISIWRCHKCHSEYMGPHFRS